MTRRSREQAPQIADLESAANPVDAPGVMPPPGTRAQVETKLRYDINVDPNASRYPDDLRALAAEELGNDDDDGTDNEALPLDPLTAFCEEWTQYSGCELLVVRHPDPPIRRRPGQEFNRPTLELENLGTIPFAPSNLVYDLQLINGNSGGVFRLFLRDNYGRLIDGARLDRIIIPDPTVREKRRRNYDDDDYYESRRAPVVAAAPEPPVKSETELMVEQAQRELFTRALSRALDPPKPEPVNPLSLMSEEDRLAMSLLQKGDLLPRIVDKIASLAQQPERIESSTWKDKLADVAFDLVTKNPAIVAQTTDIITRAAVAILSTFAPRGPQVVVSEPVQPAQPTRPVVHHPPAQRANPAIAPAPVTRDPGSLPETPQPDDDPDFDDDDPELIMLEELTKLMLSTKPIRLDDPVILDLQAEYPQQFEAALAGIASLNSGVLITYICRKSEFAAEMFNSNITGPHLRRRLEELKALVNLPPEVKQQIAEQAESALAELENNGEEAQTEDPTA